MARVRSQATMEKVEFARSLFHADPSLKAGSVGEAVKKMFGSGLSPVVLGNLKAGRDPFEKRVRKRPEKVTEEPSRKIAEVTESAVEQPPRSGEQDRPCLIICRTEGTVAECSGRDAAREEIARLLSRGVAVQDILFYKEVDVRIETRFTVTLLGPIDAFDAKGTVPGEMTSRPRPPRARKAMTVEREASRPGPAEGNLERDIEEGVDPGPDSPGEAAAARDPEEAAVRKAEQAWTKILSGGMRFDW